MKANGFTLIEMMIVVSIIGILAAVFFGQPPRNSDGTVCISGYKFVQGKQLIGSNGGGVPCSTSHNVGGDQR